LTYNINAGYKVSITDGCEEYEDVPRDQSRKDNSSDKTKWEIYLRKIVTGSFCIGDVTNVWLIHFFTFEPE
jgi:hypothetical protein